MENTADMFAKLGQSTKVKTRLPRSKPKSLVDPVTWDILQQVSACMGISSYKVALILAHFLDVAAEKVASGKMVNLPGFGTFGAKYRKAPNGNFYTYPEFAPTVGFINQVSVAVSPGDEVTRKMHELRRQRFKAIRQKFRMGERAFVAGLRIRRNIRNDMRRIGYVPDDKERWSSLHELV
jgi:hypothetical protein